MKSTNVPLVLEKDGGATIPPSNHQGAGTLGITGFPDESTGRSGPSSSKTGSIPFRARRNPLLYTKHTNGRTMIKLICDLLLTKNSWRVFILKGQWSKFGPVPTSIGELFLTDIDQNVSAPAFWIERE